MRIQKDWIKEVLAHNLKHLRTEAGFTQNQAAEISKISFRSYQQLESGKGNPTLDTIESLACTFRVTSSRLLQLVSVRIPKDEGGYLELFKTCFAKSKLTVGLRTPDGVALWVSQKFRELSGVNTSKGPVDILDSVFRDSPESQAMVRAEFNLERQGIAYPYTVSFRRPKSGYRIFYRAYPTLILPAIGRIPVWVATYFAELDQDCESNYYQFCRTLLSCRYDGRD